jgi:hypothetical protein
LAKRTAASLSYSSFTSAAFLAAILAFIAFNSKDASVCGSLLSGVDELIGIRMSLSERTESTVKPEKVLLRVTLEPLMAIIAAVALLRLAETAASVELLALVAFVAFTAAVELIASSMTAVELTSLVKRY